MGHEYLSRFPKGITNFGLLGQACDVRRNGDNKQALTYLRKLVELNPEFREVYHFIGVSEMAASRKRVGERFRRWSQTSRDPICLDPRPSRFARRDQRHRCAPIALMHFGAKSEKLNGDIEQFELRLEELEANQAAADPLPVQPAIAVVASKKPARRPLPAELPRETETFAPKQEDYPDCGGTRNRQRLISIILQK